MHVNRGFLFWGVALITAGAVALAATQGIIDPAALSGLWRLWPVVLIAIGLSVILSRTQFAWLGTLAAALVVGLAGGVLVATGPGFASCNGEPTASETVDGTFTGTSAEVDLDLTCGRMDLEMADGTAWQAVTSVEADGSQPERSVNSGSLRMRSESSGLPFARDRQSWDIQLGRDVMYDLSATLNASDSQLDLTAGRFSALDLTTNAGSTRLLLGGAAVTELDVQANAGSLTLVADGATDVTGSIGANAGSIDLCVPPEVGLRIVVESSVAFSHNLEDRGLAESDDTFTSANFETAESRIDLELQGNAASFNLNPEEGC
jgi:hypothetical protein